jgi:long-chain acyl-CoA synthetase
MSMPEFRNVGEMFLYRVGATPDIEAFSKPGPDGWVKLTWKQTADEVRDLAGGLLALGLEHEQRVALISGTRLEWILADLGVLCAGGATTTVYPNSSPEEYAFILENSDSRFIFAENQEKLDKLMGVRDRLSAVKHIILLDGKGSDDGFVLSWDELKAKGKEWNAANPGKYEEIARAAKPEDLATLIYTSGTTGQPKGVELTHDHWVYEAWAIDQLGIMNHDDMQYLWLPLAHVFGKVLEVAQIRIGFATAVDGRIEKIVENLGVVRPTFMCGVPRIFEKVHNRVVAKAKEAGGLRWKIFQWGLGVGKEVSRLQQQGQEPGGLLALQHAIAQRLVLSKVQDTFGGRIRLFVSGSAPLSREMAEFFHAFGMLICEGYGLTETSAASCVNRPGKYRFGTVGEPLPGTEVRIAESDGEILIRGRGVMRGYRGLPEATAECKTPDGWFKTGDIGEVDKDGFVKITDRKKDLIKTSGGKYVAPQFLEGKFKAICPYVSQIVIHGDNRNFCTALVALDPEAITKWAGENGLGGKSYAEIVADPKVHALIEPFIAELNQGLPSYETVKKFAILPRDLSIEEGDLTASQKLKRKVVEKKFIATLDSFYADAHEKG